MCSSNPPPYWWGWGGLNLVKEGSQTGVGHRLKKLVWIDNTSILGPVVSPYNQIIFLLLRFIHILVSQSNYGEISCFWGWKVLNQHEEYLLCCKWLFWNQFQRHGLLFTLDNLLIPASWRTYQSFAQGRLIFWFMANRGQQAFGRSFKARVE